jgi:hypothetical protein
VCIRRRKAAGPATTHLIRRIPIQTPTKTASDALLSYTFAASKEDALRLSL